MSLRDYIAGSATSHRCDALCEPVIRLYREGLSLVETGFRMGVSVAPVRGRLKYHGIRLRPRGKRNRPPATWTDQAVALWNDRHTLQAIGTIVGVTRERVRQVLRSKGINTQHRGRRKGFHFCTEACAVVLAATPPISSTRLAREAKISGGRIQRAAHIHHIPTAFGHICTQRCEKIRDLLAAGTSINQTARIVGMAATHISQRYPTYHPHWNWERTRKLPATALKVSEHIFHKKEARHERPRR